MKTKPMTFEQHKQVGEKLKDIGDMLNDVNDIIHSHYGSSHILNKVVRALIKAYDKVKFKYDDALYDDHPDNHKMSVYYRNKEGKSLTSMDIMRHVDREMKLYPYKKVIEGLKQLTEGEEKGDQLLLLGLGRIAGFLQIEQIRADYHKVISMMDAIRGTYAK